MKVFARIITAAMALALCLASCKSAYELLLEGNDSEAKYAAAFDYFNQGKFSKAAGRLVVASDVTDIQSFGDLCP